MEGSYRPRLRSAKLATLVAFRRNPSEECAGCSCPLPPIVAKRCRRMECSRLGQANAPTNLLLDRPAFLLPGLNRNLDQNPGQRPARPRPWLASPPRSQAESGGLDPLPG